MKYKFISISLFLMIFTISCESESGNNNSEPSIFNLLFLNNNATDIILTPTLTWETSTDADGDTISYQLLIDKIDDLDANEAPSTIVQSNINTNTYTLTTALMADTAYKWCVVASDGKGGETKSSSVFSFTTAINGMQDNLPPSIFTLTSPSNGATNVSLNTNLSWQTAIDPDNDPVFYDVYFGEGSPDNFIGQVQSTNFAVNQLLEGTEYNWYVLAKDVVGNVRSSSTFSFTTGDGSQGPINRISSEVIVNRDGFTGHQMVNYNGKIYLLGGLVLSPTVNGETNEVWTFDFNGQNLELIKQNDPGSSNCFVPSEEHQAVVFNNEIWVMEGNRNTVRKSTDGINWTIVGFSGSVAEDTHYTPRHQHQCVVFNNRLWIVGGSGKSDVWSTDGVENNDGLITWTKHKGDDNSAFSGRNGHQLMAFNSKLWLIGGATGNTRLNDVWSSSDGISWTEELTNAPFTARTEHTSAITGGIIPEMWIIGGNGINPNTGNTVASLNDVWSSTDGINWVQYLSHIEDDEFSGRKESEAVVTDNNVIIITGGKQNTTFLNDMWEINF